MPRVLSYTPPWLSHGSVGYDMFAPKPKQQRPGHQPASSVSTEAATAFKGAHRVIAQRGSEVFVAVGNTIRWADLALLKDGWESKQGRAKQQLAEEDPIENLDYKTLKGTVHEPIRQMVPSPSQELMAIITSHTVHIAIIPDSSHLDQPDAGPIKIKTLQVGPTVHVLSQAPVVSALWHPLGAAGDCLVTVTEDAVVRVWELSVNNRASFEQPTLDLDLSKLHHAASAKDNVASHRMGSNRGFSLDRIGMRAAAATFGGTGSDEEHGWSPMTLWVAMMEGDVYALCPLLPTKWRAPAALVPSLTTSVLAKKAYAEGSEAHEEEQRIFTAQLQWLTDIDEQEPVHRISQDVAGYEWRMPIYHRPSAVSAIPRLQGPFRILPGDVEDDLDLSGILVIPPKLDTDDLLAEDDEDLVDIDQDGLSTTVVCLVATIGRVYVTLCLEEIEGQWLPLQKPLHKLGTNPDAQPELILLEALDTLRPSEVTQTEWPMFTPDSISRYAFFITHSHGVFFMSLQPWLQRLENELQSEEPTGTSFRMAVLTKGSSTLRERLIRFEHSAGTPFLPTSGAIIFDDSDLGHFILTSHGTRPQAVVLDNHEREHQVTIPSSNTFEEASATPPPAQLTAPPRQPFQPPSVLWEHSTVLTRFLQTHVPARQRAAMHNGPVRLTSDTLDVLTGVHRELAGETHALGTAAAELFRRCERLTAELSDQVRRVRDTASRIGALLGEDVDIDDTNNTTPHDQGVRGRLDSRLQQARERTSTLQSRHEQLRRRIARLGTRPLSDIEIAWGAEIHRMSSAIDPEAGIGDSGLKKSSRSSISGKPTWQRFDEARTASTRVARQARALEDHDKQTDSQTVSSRSKVDDTSWSVPSEIRRGRMAQVMNLLDREAAMVEAARERLARLTTAGA